MTRACKFSTVQIDRAKVGQKEELIIQTRRIIINSRGIAPAIIPSKSFFITGADVPFFSLPGHVVGSFFSLVESVASGTRVEAKGSRRYQLGQWKRVASTERYIARCLQRTPTHFSFAPLSLVNETLSLFHPRRARLSAAGPVALISLTNPAIYIIDRTVSAVGELRLTSMVHC